MSPPNASPVLFLSHSGADTDAARELKRRLLESPDARAARLRVWFDKDDLAAGTGWQVQLEQAITEHATAFAVHIGARGVVNWVESEVRLALSRATGANYPFIPILSAECASTAALPPFARQYQGVRDPLNNPEEFAKLLRAVLGRAPGEQAVVLENPFVGLKSMTETDADRFFGRNQEIGELVDKLKSHRLIAVVADSGAGKSSLAQAGLIPAFRGGKLSELAGREPDDRLWHVVVMRPGRDPIEGLKRGVTEAAERLGRSAEQCAGLRKRVDLTDPSEAAYAIRCDLPVGKTETLLIVDQFEELLTETAEGARAPFVGFLIGLAGGEFRIVLTLRADHFNLCRPLVDLYERLTRDNQAAVLRLRRITDAGIAEAVRQPLALAGHSDLAEQDAVIASIRRDVSDRPGDLALVQMALYAMWQRHKADGASLLVAYAEVGGVAGALAHEAEGVRTHQLDAGERERLAPLFARLVRLGETGGATRRAAELVDLDPPRRALAGKLATEECGRLLLASETSVEVAHEALITQWPWLQNTLQQAAADMRVLDGLMDKARRWSATASDKAEHLAAGAEREDFVALAGRQPDWLSGAEREFVAASNRSHRQTARLKYGAVATLGVLFIVAAAFAVFLNIARADRSGPAGTVRGEYQDQRQGRGTAGAAVALPCRSRKPGERRRRCRDRHAVCARGTAGRAQRQATTSGRGERRRSAALFKAYRALREIGTVHEGPHGPAAEYQLRAGRKAAVDGFRGHGACGMRRPARRSRLCPGISGRCGLRWPDGKLVVTTSLNQTARIWNAETGEAVAVLEGHGDTVSRAAFSPDGRLVATASADDAARVWEAATASWCTSSTSIPRR